MPCWQVQCVKVLITGAGGQLGTDVQRRVRRRRRRRGRVLDRAQLDVAGARRRARGGHVGAPDVVIHTGAWTAVDACETDPDRALRANGLAVRWMAEACHRAGAHLVHVSTDYVFDGTLDRPYHEWDEPNPQSVYGRSKLFGEREALVARAVRRRRAHVVGVRADTAPTWSRRSCASPPSTPALAFVDDQLGCPTFTADLASPLRRIGLDRR